MYANNQTTVTYDYSWAPHHLGTWPIAYMLSQWQENMPIEETGNLLMMFAAIVQAQNDISFLYPEYWPLVQSWGEYLIEHLPDPGNQLCTDDFEGPTPHDANLAVKGIIGIDAIAYLNTFVGDASKATYFHNYAMEYAADWQHLANPNGTNHYALRYDKPGWSQKYNLVYQQILGLSTFPESVYSMEQIFYYTQLNTYGVPLDVRNTYTKLDWSYWIAATYPDQTDFNRWVNFLYDYANETPSRVPLSDFYYTTNGAQAGFQARTVVGGLWAKLAIGANK